MNTSRIKTFVVTEPDIAQGAALLEAMFHEWSKEHSDYKIMAVALHSERIMGPTVLFVHFTVGPSVEDEKVLADRTKELVEFYEEELNDQALYIGEVDIPRVATLLKSVEAVRSAYKKVYAW